MEVAAIATFPTFSGGIELPMWASVTISTATSDTSLTLEAKTTGNADGDLVEELRSILDPMLEGRAVVRSATLLAFAQEVIEARNVAPADDVEGWAARIIEDVAEAND